MSSSSSTTTTTVAPTLRTTVNPASSEMYQRVMRHAHDTPADTASSSPMSSSSWAITGGALAVAVAAGLVYRYRHQVLAFFGWQLVAVPNAPLNVAGNQRYPGRN